jgi:hypothetical protein
MDTIDYMSDKVSKRRRPGAEGRALMVERIILFVLIFGLTKLVASMAGYPLPSARDLWDHVVALAQGIAKIPTS